MFYINRSCFNTSSNHFVFTNYANKMPLKYRFPKNVVFGKIKIELWNKNLVNKKLVRFSTKFADFVCLKILFCYNSNTTTQ